jgi:alpha-ribazole phosphatase/probable phosphoglycerate mutase
VKKNNNLCTIYIVRHGESEANVLGAKGIDFKSSLEYGSKLTEKGRTQAKVLAEKFKNIKFDAIFSSDYTRTQETAAILKLERKLAVIATEVIRERQFGSWAGRWHLVKYKLHEEIRNLAEEDKMKFVFEDVETEEHLYERFNVFLREIAIVYAAKTVLVACHGNLMRTLLWKLGWATYHQLPSGSIENTGYYIIESDGTEFYLKETHGVNKKEE